VEAVGGNPSSLDDSMLFNVRFRPIDAEILDPKVPVGPHDAIRRLRRYTLVGLTGKSAGILREWPHRTATTHLGKTGVVPKAATPGGTMDLAHATLQHELYKLLAHRHGAANVVKEENFVDIKVKGNGAVTVIEVKTDGRPMHAVRDGLGQLLEYAFACQERGEMVGKLVIAAAGEKLDQRYIDRLRSERGLPLKYVCFRNGMTDVDLG
jgi:hypothetical protein